MYDVIIIGGGVSGAASARELSRYKVRACVLEKEEDVCCGTSKANSAIVHAGYDAAPGSLKAKLNVRGNEMMEQLSEDLDFPFQKTGSLVICLSGEEMPGLQELYDKGVANGVKGLKILDREEVLGMEPNITDDVYAALYAPSAGIVCPFGMNIALAENACTNGVEFRFNTEVLDIRKTENGYEIHTNRGMFQAKCVVNAAGVYADKIHNMVSKKKIHITPRRGEYCLLDKSAGTHVSRTIFSLPTKYGKGVLVTPTVHGNLLIGPTAVDIENQIMGEEKTSGWSKVWDFMKAVVGGVFGMNVRTGEMVITTVSSWLVTLIGFVLTGVSCIYLVILGLLGPLVFAISMIPNFQSSMWQWLARYIQISLWTPIVYIVQFANMKLTDACASAYLGTVSSVTNIPLLTFIVLNLIAIVAMFSVPSIAGWVIQSTGANNVQRGLSQGATYIVMAVSKFL